jgi:hypothetical protein
MRGLVASLGYDREAVVAAYADAEADGEIARASNSLNKTPKNTHSRFGAMAPRRDGFAKPQDRVAANNSKSVPQPRCHRRAANAAIQLVDERRTDQLRTLECEPIPPEKLGF